VVVRRGQIQRIGWIVNTLEGLVGRPVSSGFHVLCGSGIVVQEQDHIGDLPAAFFFKISFNCTGRSE
jgi:hypothetical protein